MLRQFLTLLAFITGLAATGAQAEIRLAAQQDVRLEARFGEAGGAQAAHQARLHPEMPHVAHGPLVLACNLCRADAAPRPLAVQLGADRAHE